VSTTRPARWTEVLHLRDEVRHTDGSVGELQMSLAKAVYQTVPVPYAKCGYFTDITQPTPKLVGFLGRVARRLGVHGVDATACFHLDQGMGGGKSHALVGLWHMVCSPDQFRDSELGREVYDVAGQARHDVDLSNVHTVVLTCDAFSPGKSDPMFGPATDLFGRFIWSLFDGHADRSGRYQHYLDRGANKATLQEAFAELDRPVLVLVDELMDYAMALTDQSQIGGLPGEQIFLNALTDAVDDQPNVALVLVMIKSEEDEAGYHPAAEGLRDYLAPRLQRNGETVAVTEPADFAQIIRRRLFDNAPFEAGARKLGVLLAAEAARSPWETEVFDQLGAGHELATLPDRIVETYPFHPDLFSLAAKEWTVVQAFQRVRSTVKIFARTALHWVDQAAAGRWAPDLIGVGDIPLGTEALESLLSSGVLAGNDRAIQGYRAVATDDVINSSGGGNAVALDARLTAAGVDTSQPHPAVRMASACFAYSLVSRPRGDRGATKPELLAALFGAGVPFTGCEEVFNAVVAGPNDGGLWTLEHVTRQRGKDRFYLTIKQTLNMYHGSALATISNDAALDHVWKTAQQLAAKGKFTLQRFVEPATSLVEAFKDLDSTENKLAVLDPRHWTLGNGQDRPTRADLDIVFGVKPGRTATYASSLVVASANTSRIAKARNSAKDHLAWEQVVAQLRPEEDEYSEAVNRRDAALAKLKVDTRRAFETFAFVSRNASGLVVEYKTVAESDTTLAGDSVWAGLVAQNRAAPPNGLGAVFIEALLDQFDRPLTPKELFQQPYSNPIWPLIATDDQLRRAVYELVTSGGWMVVDSDGGEIVLTSPSQIQTASMQQVLTRRPAEVPEADEDGGEAVARTPDTSVEVEPETTSTTGEDVYERTTVSVRYGSLSNPATRESLWKLIRELATLTDPSKPAAQSAAMLGLKVDVSAVLGATSELIAKADQAGATAEVEEDI